MYTHYLTSGASKLFQDLKHEDMNVLFHIQDSFVIQILLRRMKNLIVILLSFLINLYKYYNFKVHAIKQKKFSFLEFKHLTKISFQFIYLYGSNILFSQNVKRSARDQIQFDSVDITENATRIYIANCNTDNALSCKEPNRRK